MKYLALLSFFLAVPLMAQTQYVGSIGGGFDTSLSPHTSAEAGLMIGDGTNWSYSRFIARGPQNKRLTFSFDTGYRRNVKQFYAGRLAVYSEGLGGVAHNSQVVSGIITGKAGVTWKKTPTVSLDLGAGVSYAPADNGMRPAATLRILFTPKQ